MPLHTTPEYHMNEIIATAEGLIKTAKEYQPNGADGDIADAIRTYAKIRETYEAVKALSTHFSNQVNLWSYGVIPDRMREEGIKTITVEGTGRVTVNKRVSASMPDKMAGMEWLKENEHGDLITETVNASTLGAFARTMMESGFDLPDDVFKVTISDTTSLTKAK